MTAGREQDARETLARAALLTHFHGPGYDFHPAGRGDECQTCTEAAEVAVAALLPSPPATTEGQRHPVLTGRPEWDGVCGVEHEPGRLCVQPRGHPSPPAIWPCCPHCMAGDECRYGRHDDHDQPCANCPPLPSPPATTGAPTIIRSRIPWGDTDD